MAQDKESEQLSLFRSTGNEPLPVDIKKTFDNIRNHIAANAQGITRDETIAKQIINILFCKLFSELNKDYLFDTEFEDPEKAKKKITNYFEDTVKSEFYEIFSAEDKIRIDSETLHYTVNRLSNYRLTELKRDSIGNAFEFFITPALKGSQGQFFTPKNAVKLMVDIVDPKPGEIVLDPACGSGGFLVEVVRHMLNNGKGDLRERASLQDYQILGIDKDEFLVKVSKAYMGIIGKNFDNIFCENSLKPEKKWGSKMQRNLSLEAVDVILTNPPFGVKQKVKDNSILEQFDLAHKWKKDDRGGWKKTERVVNTPVQILFIERALQFLKSGGRMGIVLPESIFGNPSYKYIMHFLRKRTKILGILAMPDDLFQPYTHAKTCLAFFEKKAQPKDDYDIFMARAKWCGHDSRGNPTVKEDPQTGEEILLDDLPKIAERFKEASPEEPRRFDRYCFYETLANIQNNIFVPRYYDPELEQNFDKLSETHDLISLGELIEEGVVSIDTGVEVGKLAYGTGDIPFIRTSDIANWEIKIDPQHSVSDEIYQEYKDKVDIRPDDILLVKDGTSLIGKSCIITEHDTKILYQSHLYKLRVEKKGELDPYLLFAALNSPLVLNQIKARQFTQNIIDSLSKTRLKEILLPLPRESKKRGKIAQELRDIVNKRAQLREKAQEVATNVEK